MTENLSKGAKRRERQAYDVADTALEGFTDLIYGVESSVRYVPITAGDRLARSFGNGDVEEQLGLFRDVLMLFSPRIQQDLLLYFSGYPMSTLKKLASDQLDDSLVECSTKLIELGLPQIEPNNERSLDTRFGDHEVVRRVGLNRGVGATAYRGYGGVPAYKIDGDWRLKARCSNEDPELFEENENDDVIEKARSYCLQCDVMRECLLWSLVHEENDGTLGALSSRERKEIPISTRKKMIALLSGRPLETDRRLSN